MSDHDLETFGASLSSLRAVRAPDALRARLRAELLSAPLAATAPRRSLLALWRAALVPGALAAVLLIGAGSAAASSLPGEPAFALKRAVEELQLALTGDEGSRAALAVELADRRLADLRATAARPELAPSAAIAYEEAWSRVRALAGAVQGTPASPRRDSILERLSDAREHHEGSLGTLRDRLPEPAKEGLDRAIEQQDRVKDSTPPRHAPESPRASPRVPEADEDEAPGSDRPESGRQGSAPATPEPEHSDAPRRTEQPRATPTPERTEEPESVSSPRPTDQRRTPTPSPTRR